MGSVQKRRSYLGGLWRVLPFLIFILSLVSTWYTASVYSRTILDSDASSEMVLANLLSRQNAILSPDWYYSTELRVIQTNLIFAPLFKVFSSWGTVRFVGTVILQILLVLSYGYFCRKMGWSWRTFFYSASLLVLPYSIQYGRIVLYHTYYLPYAALGFWLVGLYLSVWSQRSEPSRRIGRYGKHGLLLLLSLLSGLNGLRQLMVTMAPLLLAALWLVFQEEKRHKEPAGMLWHKWRGAALSLQVCLFGGIGYFINDQVLGKSYSFRSYTSTRTNFLSPDSFVDILRDFFAQFGFQRSRPFFSVGGILALGGAFVALYALMAAIQNLRVAADEPAREESSPQSRLLGAFIPMAWAITALLFVFTNVVRHYFQYWIPATLWVVPLLAMGMERWPEKGSARGALLLAVCLVCAANGVYNNGYFLHPEERALAYEGLVWQDIHTVEKMQGAVGFLRENGYTLGYAPFWQANVVTEITNGEIPMVGIQINPQQKTARYYDWLSNKAYREEAFAANQKAFILLSLQDTESFLETPQAEMAHVEPVYRDDHFIIYAPEDAYDIWYALQE